MVRTNIIKCRKVLSTCSGNDQRACGLIIQRVQSTKKNTPPPRGTKKGIFKVAPEEEDMEDIPSPIKIKELHIWYQPISKLYIDDCGSFPIRSRSGNEYIMIEYHFDSNTII